MNRVVVTELGAATPLGNDVASFWDGLVAGKNGGGPLTKFAPSGYKAKMAAEVRGFNPEHDLSGNEINRTGLFTQYALAAASSASIPFDRRRSGFALGESSGALILENYAHVKVRDAIRAAGKTEEDRIYCNAHGTSTTLNDKCETLALKQALGEDKARRALVSSTKSMTGHMLGAAGAVEAIAAVLALKTGMVPPTTGLQEPDPDCDLDYVPNTARKAGIHPALSASFGFGGHNACIAFIKTEEHA